MLDRSKSAPPMYLQIANKLSKDIQDKKFDIGDFLPSESQLCQQYDVSRMTARLALTELEKMGLIERIACYNMLDPKNSVVLIMLFSGSNLSYNEEVIGLTGHCLS